MFQNLLYAVKSRFMDEVELAFDQHPAFDQKVKVYNKFPYIERVQYGCIFKNASATQIRLSADNFMSDLFSHVRVGRQQNYPGLAIEWVRENEGYVTEYITEDVSAQFNGINYPQRQFTTSVPICAGPGETHYATDPGQVCVKVNGFPHFAEFVNGETGVVLLKRSPELGAVVTISYHQRRISIPAIYVIDFIEDNQFTVAPIYVVEKEVIIASTTGTETSATLDNGGVDPDTEDIYIAYKSGKIIDTLIRDVDYSIDYSTGVITFLPGHPLPSNRQLLADYHWQPSDYYNGPYTFVEYQEFHTVIPGVIISIGRRAKKGDQQVVIVSQFREQQAKIYGGHWTMALDVSVIAKDPIQMAQMADHIVSQLWGIRKNILEFQGITLNSVEPTGETEEVHIETTGDLYYESSVAINVQTEWQSFVPYVYYFRLKNIILWPSLSPVFKAPVVGYERLT
jgi:hypothetical protein